MNNNFIEGESPVDNLKHLLIIMRITFCFLFLGILLAQAAPGYSQETELNIDLKTASIQDVSGIPGLLTTSSAFSIISFV
jgi:hypothetical protein